jgi:hypothetical protein
MYLDPEVDARNEVTFCGTSSFVALEILRGGRLQFQRSLTRFWIDDV